MTSIQEKIFTPSEVTQCKN